MTSTGGETTSEAVDEDALADEGSSRPPSEGADELAVEARGEPPDPACRGEVVSLTGSEGGPSSPAPEVPVFC